MSAPFEWRDCPRAEFAVIGDPVAHSLSPKMHMAAFRALGLPFRYVAVRVAAGEVADALDHLQASGFRGANVTVPNKEEAFDWLVRADTFSERVRATNTVSLGERSGTNSDGPGFVDTLADLGFGHGSPVVVLGAGGSSRAICLALFQAGYEVSLWNRTRSRADDLVALLDVPIRVLDAPSLYGAQLVVNATSSGFSSDDLGLDWDRAAAEAVAYDLMYESGPTPFLARAQEHGLRVKDGRQLLMAQGARSLEWWLGVGAPREAMLEAIL